MARYQGPTRCVGPFFIPQRRDVDRGYGATSDQVLKPYGTYEPRSRNSKMP